MKKLILLIVAIGVMLLAGCTPATQKPLPWPADKANDTGIIPSKVKVGNFSPGDRAEYPLTIHNGSDQQAQFSVIFLAAGDVDADTGYVYVAAPQEAQGWVIIAEPTLVLAAKDTKAVLIVLEMPKNATAPANRWEFRIVVKDTTQTGMVQTANACRWLVTMK
jgi:hypothetical protein